MDLDDDSIAKWLEEAEEATGEVVEAVLIGKHYDDDYTDNDRRPAEARGAILARGEAMPILSEKFHSGFGGADCFPTYAWSKSWVFFVHEYDGATNLHRVPRNPMFIEPEFGGNYFD